MPQPCSSLRLVLTLERATSRASTMSSALSGSGERYRSACTWATVRLTPQRVPISPQWRMNFCWTDESLVLVSIISVTTEYTDITDVSTVISRRRCRALLVFRLDYACRDHLSARLLNGGFSLAESYEASLLNTLSSAVIC